LQARSKRATKRKKKGLIERGRRDIKRKAWGGGGKLVAGQYNVQQGPKRVYWEKCKLVGLRVTHP